MYYLMINGQKTGPYSAGDVSNMLRQNAIGFETQIWREGSMDWNTVGGLRSQFSYSPQITNPNIYQDTNTGYYPPAQPGMQPMQYQQGKSRIAYILLGIFLGSLGIHNFYAGYTGKAVTQLLLFIFLFWTIVVPLGLWIWMIYEVITVENDADGLKMI
jgi:TM2 domain-containing membrane protein YozV